MFNMTTIASGIYNYVNDYTICDSLYEKGPYHAQIEFSVQTQKKIFFQIFFFFFFLDFYGSMASYPTFKPNMTQNEPFLASVTQV